MFEKAKKVIFPLSALLLFFLIWEFSSYIYKEHILILPSPSGILIRLFKGYDRFLYHSKTTCLEMIGGFFLALAISFPLGFLMHIWNGARLVLQPLFIFIQCIPMFALAPIMVIWFGWSYTAIVIPTALMIFFPLTISIYQGLKAAPKELIDYFTINQATPWQIFYKLKLPFALTHIFSGFRISAATAGIGAVAGEFAGAKSGLGILMLESRRATDLDTTFAALFCLSFISMSFYLIILMVENIMVKKKTSSSKALTPLLLAFGLLLTGCSNIERSSETKKSTRLLLDWLPNPNHVPLYVGVDKGIFEKHGIDLQIQKIADPSDAIPYVIAGNAELALFYMPDTIRAIEAGHDLTQVAVLFKQPLNSIIFRRGEGINQPSDLNGKIIGYSVDGSSTAVLDYILQKNDIIPADKQNVTFDLVSTLCTKQVDAIYGAYWNIECEHLNSLNQKTTHFDLLSLGFPNYYELIVVAKGNGLQAEEQFKHAFQKALQESIDYSVQNSEEAFTIYSHENMDKSPKTLEWEKASWDRTYTVLAKDQHVDAEVSKKLRTWLIEHELIK